MLNQSRSTQRPKPKTPDDEPRLLQRIIDLATKFGRYGYRRITELLRREGWNVNHRRVERLWRREGLKVPQKQPKKRRSWRNDGSCIRLPPERLKHVWAYDFVHHRKHDGRAFRLLVVVDEFTRECLAIDVARRLRSGDVPHRLAELFTERGAPEYIRSDNRPEFTAESVRDWLERLEVGTLFIEPGSPWENGYVESLNGKLRDELLERGIFDTLWEARTLIECWRKECNTFRRTARWGTDHPSPKRSSRDRNRRGLRPGWNPESLQDYDRG